MSTRAAGPFDVKMLPQGSDTPADGPPIARFRLEKRYHGDLDAIATGEMISTTGGVKGSAAYSAIERVSGTLHGRSGTFVLQHTGVMDRGVPSLLVTVVPDSATGDLAGLAGTMAIEITGKDHAYRLDYTLGRD